MVIKHDVELGDKISGPAKSAASAVAGVSREMTVLSKALTSAQDKMTKAAATGNIAGFKKAGTEVANLKAAISVLPAPTVKVAQATTQLQEAQQGASSSSAGLQAELAEMTGGLSLVVEALGAAALGMAVLVVAGARMAIQANEAKAKMTGLFDALGGGVLSGKEAIGMLDELGDKIGQTREQLAPLAKAFVVMGVTGKEELQGLTLAAASAGAMVEGGAEKFTKLIGQIKAADATGQKLVIPFKKLDSQLRGMGLNVDDLAKQMGMSSEKLAAGLKAGTIDAGKLGDALTDAATNKGAGPLAKAGASLGNVWAKAQENISKFFEDVDVGPFLEQVKGMFDILGQANPSGQALKAGIGGFFKQVFEQATKVVPLVKHFMLDLIILGLKAYLAVKPIVKSFNEWRQSASGMKTISTILGVVGAVLLTIGAVIGIAVAAFLALWVVMVGIGLVIWAFIAAVIAIPQMAGAALADFFGKAPQLAKDFISGLVDGIANGASAVVGAVKDLAGGAVKGFKSALGISSPSKVMAQMGGHMGAGLEGGLEDASPGVAAATGSMAGAAMAGASAAAGSSGGSSGGGGGGVNVTFAAGAIVINGAGKDAEELSEESMALAWEKIALQGGL